MLSVGGFTGIFIFPFDLGNEIRIQAADEFGEQAAQSLQVLDRDDLNGRVHIAQGNPQEHGGNSVPGNLHRVCIGARVRGSDIHGNRDLELIGQFLELMIEEWMQIRTPAERDPFTQGKSFPAAGARASTKGHVDRNRKIRLQIEGGGSRASERLLLLAVATAQISQAWGLP